MEREGHSPSKWNTEKKCVFNECTLTVCVLEDVLVTSHLIASLYICTCKSTLHGESRVRERDKVVVGRNGREESFPDDHFNYLAPP